MWTNPNGKSLMLSEYTFIRIYKSLANGKAKSKEILGLYSDLQAILGENTPFAKWFKEESPDRLGAAIAIDAVAHAIHQDGEDTLHQIFPDAEYSIIKLELDNLAGLEKNNQIRQYNRGYFTTLLAEDSVFLLEKQMTQVGRTTREAILPAIKEYEKLYKAGLSSPAEILTLSRFYPDNEQYRATILKLGLDNEENQPVIVGGPASVEMIDREGHLITTEALDKAFTKFMANFRERNLNILHSDVTVGWVLPSYITKDGRVFSSGVDDRQLWVLGEIRGDTRIAKRVAQEVLDKNLRSYSIAGSALDVQDMQKGVNTFKQVNELEISEFTLCEKGMNQGSNFSLIKSIDTTPSLDSILSSFQDELSPFSGAQIYVENTGEIPSVIIKADKYNSIIDMLVLELQKMLPENTSVVVKYDVSDAIPVYKMQLVPIWTTPQTEREADHSFPAKLGDNIIAKDAAEGTPPRSGLVPQTGDYQHPYRWIREEPETSAGTVSRLETKQPEVSNLERGLSMSEQTVKTNYLQRYSSGLSRELQKAIIQSRIPSTHLAGVFIKVTDKKYLAPTKTAPYGAAGKYDLELQRILLASETKSHTSIHEIGHHAYHTIFKDLSFEIWHIYKAAKDSKKGFPSEYSKNNESEFFAECYLAYVKNPEAFRKKNAPMAQLLEKLW